MDLITLEAQSERAVIVPAAGCQCLSYSVGALDIIAGPPNPDSWRAHPHRGGIPILFPWPGRIAGARFNFKGREYLLPTNEPARGHAIHGFACERPFRVSRQGPYYVTAILDSSEHPDLASIWPYSVARVQNPLPVLKYREVQAWSSVSTLLSGLLST